MWSDQPVTLKRVKTGKGANLIVRLVCLEEHSFLAVLCRYNEETDVFVEGMQLRACTRCRYKMSCI